MRVSLPKSYKAVLINGLDQPFQLIEKELPQPRKGQVLVKIAASPINPSDLSFLEGRYADPKPLPFVPGFEASGTVAASGGGLLANYVLGKRVGLAASTKVDGTWAEYVLTNATSLIPLHKSVGLEQGSMSLVNPLTVYAFVDIAKKHRQKTLVHTAAASQLGRMLLRWAAKEDMTLINIVRRPAQVELLRSLGAEYVLDSSEPDFEQELEALCRKLDARLAFDAVAGEVAEQVFNALPPKSVLYTYGSLSQRPIRTSSRRLIFEEKTIRGFYLSYWIQKQSILRNLLVASQVQRELITIFKSEVQARYPLSQARQAVERYQQNMTGGKVLIVPGIE